MGAARTRGRKPKLSTEAIHAMGRRTEENGFDGHTISWAELLAAANLDTKVPTETVRRHPRNLSLRRCLACQKSYVSPKLGNRRLEYASTTPERYPVPQDQYHAGFSDETHFGREPEERDHAIRRPCEKDCADRVREKKESPPRALKRARRAATGHDFESPLHRYNVLGNLNGKMSLKVYKDATLKPIVGSRLREGQQFVVVGRFSQMDDWRLLS